LILFLREALDRLLEEVSLGRFDLIPIKKTTKVRPSGPEPSWFSVWFFNN
jgi:hypothetical protein